VPALHGAIDFINAYSLGGLRPNYIQVPHHGSRHNVSVELLNRLLGPPNSGYTDNRWAIVSASDQDEKHPHPRVLNAFKRRGYGTVTTEDSFINLNVGFPPRPNVQPVPALPWYEEGDD
jgi:hypothetical protein